MAKHDVLFTCSNCDAQYPKWQGRCSQCGQWGTIEAGAAPAVTSGKQRPTGTPGKTVSFVDLAGAPVPRTATGIAEVDRTLGGGIVPGSLMLLGGEPGIGKSTLALQITAGIRAAVLYVSGEESASQVKLRYDRLGMQASNVQFLAETDLPTVLATLEASKPSLVVIDSIQTLFDPTLPSEAGSLIQVRVATVQLMAVAKQMQVPVLLIGHVTKDGSIAGPRVLEHLVDVVLTMEGDPYHAYRILRATKNRFGATDEVGVFDMAERGLVEVPNPSERFLAERPSQSSGSAVVPILEGTRAFLLDIQALVTPTVFGYPQRVASGFDSKRLQLLLAVLTKRVNAPLGNHDVHLNVVGGFRISEPAADLGVCMSVMSSFSDQPLPDRLSCVGEVGLGGEVRGVAHLTRRLAECAKLGFTEVLGPAVPVRAPAKLHYLPVRTLAEAQRRIAGTKKKRE